MGWGGQYRETSVIFNLKDHSIIDHRFEDTFRRKSVALKMAVLIFSQNKAGV